MPAPTHPLPATPGRSDCAARYERLNAQIVALLDELGGLPSPAHAEQIWRGIWLKEVHNSTAIEGNTLVLTQVEQLLSEGRAVGNKDLSEYLEVQGYGSAANYPFLDGNGRAGRLVLNLLLVRLGYAPAIVPKADRPRYLTALRRCDAGDPAPLSELLARAVLHNLGRFVVPAQPPPSPSEPHPYRQHASRRRDPSQAQGHEGQRGARTLGPVRSTQTNAPATSHRVRRYT